MAAFPMTVRRIGDVGAEPVVQAHRSGPGARFQPDLLMRKSPRLASGSTNVSLSHGRLAEKGASDRRSLADKGRFREAIRRQPGAMPGTCPEIGGAAALSSAWRWPGRPKRRTAPWSSEGAALGIRAERLRRDPRPSGGGDDHRAGRVDVIDRAEPNPGAVIDRGAGNHFRRRRRPRPIAMRARMRPRSRSPLM